MHVACFICYIAYKKNKSQRLSWLRQEKTQQVSLGFSLVTLSTRRCGMCHLNQKKEKPGTPLKFGLFEPRVSDGTVKKRKEMKHLDE